MNDQSPKSEAKSSLWPQYGQVRISDAEILDDMIQRIPTGEDPILTSDSLYSAFVETKKASDEWIKYYMISLALLVMAAAGAIKTLQIFNVEIVNVYIAPAAILYFSVCIVVYTNNELKIRMYRVFFNRLLSAMNGQDRARVLLRYPLAFPGPQFSPWQAKPDEFVIGWGSFFKFLPLLAILALWWVLAVFGTLGLAWVMIYGIFREPLLPSWVKWGTSICLTSAFLYSSGFLRGERTKQKYIHVD